MKIQWQSRTRGGISVVLYDESVQDPDGFTIHGRVHLERKGRWVPQAWRGNGSAFIPGVEHPLDLLKRPSAFGVLS